MSKNGSEKSGDRPRAVVGSTPGSSKRKLSRCSLMATR